MIDFVFKDEKYKHLQIVDILLTNDNQIVNVYFKYPSGLLDNRLFDVSEIEVNMVCHSYAILFKIYKIPFTEFVEITNDEWTPIADKNIGLINEIVINNQGTGYIPSTKARFRDDN